MRAMGWKKDKFDKRDYTYDARRGALRRSIPDRFSMKEFLPDVRDQGNILSCVGHAIGGVASAIAKKAGVFIEWFSPTWIHNGARFIEGTLNEDLGVYPRDAFEWVKTKGCLLESYWLYNPIVLDKTPPPSSLEWLAARWPVLSYHRVTGGPRSICDVLADGYLVAIGAPWYEEWTEEPSGILSCPSDNTEPTGGHETFIYGYDIPYKLFHCQNSWGKGWGANGKFILPFAVFDKYKKDGGYDAYYMKVEWRKLESKPPDGEKFDKLTGRDFENGAIRDEIRYNLKRLEELEIENMSLKKEIEKLRFLL